MLSSHLEIGSVGVRRRGTLSHPLLCLQAAALAVAARGEDAAECCAAACHGFLLLHPHAMAEVVDARPFAAIIGGSVSDMHGRTRVFLRLGIEERPGV